jgi:hypothetical protein
MSSKYYEDVEVVANAYIKATYKGDLDQMRSIFSSTAVMNGYLDGELISGGPEPFFNQLETSPSLESLGAPYKAEVKSIDVDGDVASVVIHETGYGPMTFTNYLHLVKKDTKWEITSKTFVGRG